MTGPAHRSGNNRKRQRAATVDAAVNVKGLNIESTCGHPLEAGDRFFIRRAPTTLGTGNVDRVSVTCSVCEADRAIEHKEEAK